MDLDEYNRRRRMLVERLQLLGADILMPQTVWASLVNGDAVHICHNYKDVTHVKVVRAHQLPIETLFGITPGN